MPSLIDIDPRSVPGINNSPYIFVDTKQQMMYLLTDKNIILNEYLISTAKNGLGELKNSYQTPRGWHTIRALIGDKQPCNTIFKARRTTGQVYTEQFAQDFPLNQDWILTRILWLSGLEPGINRFGDVDTMQRYIYIHGSPEHRIDGTPGSRGCIRMRSLDIIDLFNKVKFGTKIFVAE